LDLNEHGFDPTDARTRLSGEHRTRLGGVRAFFFLPVSLPCCLKAFGAVLSPVLTHMDSALHAESFFPECLTTLSRVVVEPFAASFAQIRFRKSGPWASSAYASRISLCSPISLVFGCSSYGIRLARPSCFSFLIHGIMVAEP